MIDSAEGSTRSIRMETEPESEAVSRSLKTQLSQLCVLGDKLTGQCAKDCFDQDDKAACQEQFSQ